MDKTILIVVVVFVLFILSSSSGGLLYFYQDDLFGGGEQQEEITTPAPNTTTTPAPNTTTTSAPNHDENGNFKQGWPGSLYLIDDQGFFKSYGKLSNCRAMARNFGIKRVGHRNDNHNSEQYKNTCFFLVKLDGQNADFNENTNDNVHISACTDPSKTWTNCEDEGNSKSGYTSFSFCHTCDTPVATSMRQCRDIAKGTTQRRWFDPQFAGVGFRTGKHASHPNTCFFYHNGMSMQLNNHNNEPNDGTHFSACMDPTRTFPDCE